MGPLQGIRIVELAGLGPAPFCAMLLADLGAEVICIDRRAAGMTDLEFLRHGPLTRGRRRLTLDLKQPKAVELVLGLVARADGLVEGFRPGVMERLGLGPEVCLERNPRLVYGRMTGWGQHGPLAAAAGHDIDYIALSGALHAIGPAGGPPLPPLNLVGDFGGGCLLLAFGLVCALLEARRSGEGQVVDAAMTDGAALLMAMIYGFKGQGRWSNSRGDNLLDGAAPFYGTYQCADGHWLAVGAIEPQFYALLLDKLGLADPDFQAQWDRERWPRLRDKLAAVFRARTRDQWCELLEGLDACVAPVLDLDEAPAHAHNRARETFMEIDGITQPAPAPRFSRTPSARPVPVREEGGAALLGEWGFDEAEIGRLRAAGVVG